MGTTLSSSSSFIIKRVSCEQRKAYGQRLKESLGGESYSRVRYEEAILEICSRNRVG